MTKNYFTDEQVKAIAKKSGIDISYLGYFHELKRLMNLAVEAAIGEAVAFVDVDANGGAQMVGKVLTYDGDPLYSVKELEN